jgi:hypothetical protein
MEITFIEGHFILGNIFGFMDVNSQDSTLIYITGVLKKGYGIASGSAENSPYPKGSIALQAPHFLKRGLDISRCYKGTLNISIAPYRFKMVDPEWVFERVPWYNGYVETFSFSRCKVVYREKEVEGFVYYPHPDTKPDHFHDDSLLEVLSPYLGSIREGEKLILFLNTGEIEVYTS